MKIETKFDVGRVVWLIEENKIKAEAIKKLEITKDERDENIRYYFTERPDSMNWERSRLESQVFATKEELINNL